MKINFYKIFFIISYIFIIFPYAFNKVEIDKDFLYIIYVISLLMLVGLFLYEYIFKAKKIKRNTLIFLLVIFGLGLISSYAINNTIMLRTFLFICAFKNIKFKDFIKTDMIIRISAVIILFILWNLELAASIEVFRGEMIRYSFGFNHPNKFGLYIMLICLDLTYLCANKKLSYKHLLVIIMSVLCFIVYYFANSRASVFLMLCCIFLMLFNKEKLYKLINVKFFKFLITNSVLLFTIFSFSLVPLYRNDSFIAKKIDTVTSGRIHWISEYLKNYDVNLFGNELKLFGTPQKIGENEYLTLDNNYAFFTLHYGVPFMIIMIILFKKTFVELYKKKNYLCIILLMMYVIYGFMESTLLKFYLNPFMVLLNYALFKDKNFFDKREISE